MERCVWGWVCIVILVEGEVDGDGVDWDLDRCCERVERAGFGRTHKLV